MAKFARRDMLKQHLCNNANRAGLFAGVWHLKERFVLVWIELLALWPERFHAIYPEHLHQR